VEWGFWIGNSLRAVRYNFSKISLLPNLM